MSTVLAWCGIACVVLAGSLLHKETRVSALPRIQRLLFLAIILLAVATLTGCATTGGDGVHDWQWFLHDDCDHHCLRRCA